MPTRVRRKDNESLDRALSRFSRKIKHSKVLTTAREKKYHQRPLSKRLARATAKARDMYRARREQRQYQD